MDVLLIIVSPGLAWSSPCLCGDAVDDLEEEDSMWMDGVSLSMVSVVSVLCMLLSGDIF